MKLRTPGTADTGDVYGGGVGAAGPQDGLGLQGLHPGGGPHYLGVLQHQPRALQQQLLQKHILADLDLTPRPRPQQPVRSRVLLPTNLPTNDPID